MTTQWYIGYTLIVAILGAIIGYSVCALMVIASDEEHAVHVYDQGYQDALRDHKKANFITIDKE